MTVRDIYQGTSGEPFDVTVRSADVLADATPVSIRLGDSGAFVTAAWRGTAGVRRTARITLTPVNTPAATDVPFGVYVNVGGVIVKAGEAVVHPA